MYTLSQILIIFSDIAYVLSMLCKKKSGVIMFLFFSGFFFASHYFCLNEITASLIIIIDTIFLITLFIVEKYKKEKYTPFLITLTIIACIVVSILTMKGLTSLIILGGMLIYLIGMFFKNVVVVKSCTFIRVSCNMIHMLFVKSYLGAILSLVLLASSIIGIVIDIKNKKKNNQTLETHHQKS